MAAQVNPPEKEDKTLYMALFEAISEPNKRLGKIADQYRQIAKNLEAGKAVTPKRIKTLAGSIGYWSEKAWYGGINCWIQPMMLMSAYCEHRKLTDPPIEKPPPKPLSEEERLALDKNMNAINSFFRILGKVKAGELPTSAVDLLIEKIGEVEGQAGPQAAPGGGEQ
jgi:hypothetical protein